MTRFACRDVAIEMRQGSEGNVVTLDLIAGHELVQGGYRRPMPADEPLDETGLGEALSTALLAVAGTDAPHQRQIARLAERYRRIHRLRPCHRYVSVGRPRVPPQSFRSCPGAPLERLLRSSTSPLLPPGRLDSQQDSLAARYAAKSDLPSSRARSWPCDLTPVGASCIAIDIRGGLTRFRGRGFASSPRC